MAAILSRGAGELIDQSPQGKQKLTNTNFTWNKYLYVDIPFMNNHVLFMVQTWCGENLIKKSWIYLVGHFKFSSRIYLWHWPIQGRKQSCTKYHALNLLRLKYRELKLKNHLKTKCNNKVKPMFWKKHHVAHEFERHKSNIRIIKK